MDAVSEVRHRRRPLRRLLLPVPGRGRGVRRRGAVRAVRRRLGPSADWRRDNINALITGAGRRDQGGQAMGQVRRLAVRRLDEPGDRPDAARHPGRRCRPTTTCTRTPAGGSGRSGSTTSARRSTGPRAWPSADYNVLVDWWSERGRAARNVHLYIGQATYKIGASTQSPEWNDLPAGDEQPPALQLHPPGGGRQHLLQRQGRPRQPARRHGDRRARLVPPPRAGAADAVDRRSGPNAPAQGPVGRRGRVGDDRPVAVG